MKLLTTNKLRSCHLFTSLTVTILLFQCLLAFSGLCASTITASAAPIPPQSSIHTVLGSHAQGRVEEVSFGTITPFLYRPDSGPIEQRDAPAAGGSERQATIEKRSKPLLPTYYDNPRVLPITSTMQSEKGSPDLKKRGSTERSDGYVPGGPGSGGQYDKGQPYGR